MLSLRGINLASLFSPRIFSLTYFYKSCYPAIEKMGCDLEGHWGDDYEIIGCHAGV